MNARACYCGKYGMIIKPRHSIQFEVPPSEVFFFLFVDSLPTDLQRKIKKNL